MKRTTWNRLKLHVAGLLALLFIVLAACGHNLNEGSLFPERARPTFSISLNPSSLTIQQGASGTTALTVTPQNGFTGAVSLSLAAAPTGVSLSPTSVSVPGPNPVTQTLTLSVGDGVAPGNYSFQVKATSGKTTRYASLTLTVTPRASPGLSADFSEAAGDIPNPERGFAGDSYYPDEPTLDASAKVAEARAKGFEIRLIRRTYYLHAYAGQDTLPSSFLNTLAQDLGSARAAGVKLILRFAYRPDENHPGGPVYCDPPKERILAHLAQLGSILRAHKGAIAYLEAGLIGPWGEWHSASPEAGLMDPYPWYSEGSQPPCGQYNYDRKLPNANTLEIVQALLAEVPGRMVAVRYPMAKAKLLELEAGGPLGTYPATSSFTPLTGAEAHGEGLKARLGGHNDCFLASPNDYGTYYYDSGSQQDLEKAYWSEDSRYTVMGGETCTSRPYVPSGQDPATYVYGAFQRFRFNNLNINYHPDFMAWLASQPFGGSTLLEALKRDLGYRLHLRRVEIDRGQVPVGGSLELRLYLANRGFGGMYNPKVLSLVFLREDGARVERTLSPAFFGPPPGEEAAYAYTVRAPESPGSYRLYLRLSDPDLPGDTRYNVQLATRTAYVDGMNDLTLSLQAQ